MTSHASPTGTQHVLRTAGAEAVVTEVGGGLRSLRVSGRDLVVSFAADEPRPVFRGSVLAPWPNRIADGRWSWDGTVQQLALTEPDRCNALHGLACHLPFSAVESSESTVSLRGTVWPQPGYPAQLELTVQYDLDDDGLTWSLEAVNRGSVRAPYGCGVHPYLLAGAALDDSSLRLPVRTVLDVDADRLLPVGTRAVHGTELDFSEPRLLRDLVVDHAFTEVDVDEDGLARAVLSAEAGWATVLEWDPAVLPWVQVCTADRPEPLLHRAGLAVEPMSCPPDAFRSGRDLVIVEPGERHRVWWRLRSEIPQSTVNL